MYKIKFQVGTERPLYYTPKNVTCPETTPCKLPGYPNSCCECTNYGDTDLVLRWNCKIFPPYGF